MTKKIKYWIVSKYFFWTLPCLLFIRPQQVNTSHFSITSHLWLPCCAWYSNKQSITLKTTSSMTFNINLCNFIENSWTPIKQYNESQWGSKQHWTHCMDKNSNSKSLPYTSIITSAWRVVFSLMIDCNSDLILTLAHNYKLKSFTFSRVTSSGRQKCCLFTLVN